MALLQTRDDLQKQLAGSKCDCGNCNRDAASVMVGCANHPKSGVIAKFLIKEGLILLICKKCKNDLICLPIASTKSYQAERN